MSHPEHRLKLLLCGSNYGASYVPALDGPTSAFELAGVLAKGSERSVRLAAAKNVPLWSRVEEVPDDVAVAVVALPSPAAETVTAQLIRRGVHVLMEHPVDAEVLRDVRQVANAANIVQHVNCHFAELSAPRAFIEECTRRLERGAATYASIVTAARSAYATFDLLGRALGGLSDPVLEQELTSTVSPAAYPFASFRGAIQGVPVRVQCSGSAGAADDGSDSPVPQRIEVGFADGHLMLLGPAGPVVWSETLRLALRTHPGPLWSNVAGQAVTFGELMGDRVNANKRALDELHLRLAGGQEPPHQSTPWLTQVAKLTQVVRPATGTSGGS